MPQESGRPPSVARATSPSLLAHSCPRSPLLPAPGASLVGSEGTSAGCPGRTSATAPALLGQLLGECGTHDV